MTAGKLLALSVMPIVVGGGGDDGWWRQEGRHSFKEGKYRENQETGFVRWCATLQLARFIGTSIHATVHSSHSPSFIYFSSISCCLL